MTHDPPVPAPFAALLAPLSEVKFSTGALTVRYVKRTPIERPLLARATGRFFPLREPR